MRIAVVCTVRDGGMVHFARRCFRAVSESGNNAMVIFPKEANVDGGSLEKFGEVCTYDAVGGINKGKLAANIILNILEDYAPDSVWLTDETVTSASVRAAYPESVIFIHDVKPHLAKRSVRACLRFTYLLSGRRRAFARASRIVVMSYTSRRDLLSRYGTDLSSKISVLRLGATAPNCSAAIPPELNNKFREDYFLFFGAIEKYKNVEGLVRAFSSLLKEHPTAKLVIAGRGTVDGNAVDEINRHGDSIIFLNRYISDGELVFLMKGARAVVLPYLEASQSGVLPISYSFGKPVITSAAPGLAEFVVNEETGLVVEDETDLVSAMTRLLDDKLAKRLGGAGHTYAKHNLDFTTNIARVITDIASTGGSNAAQGES